MSGLFRVDGGSFVVTGAGSGIGRATARLLAEYGAAHLILVGRREEQLNATASTVRTVAPNCMAHVIAGDVVSAKTHAAISDLARSLGGRLSGLVNNAGYFKAAGLASTTDEEWRHHLDVNLTAPFALARALLPYLEASPGSAIVNVSSTLAEKPIPGTSAYNAAKAGLIQMTRTLAVELGPKRVRVNAVLPAIVETPMYAGRFKDRESYDRGLQDAARLHPIGRIGQPDDVAAAIVFLMSPGSSWITGVALPVDGGMLCT